jgi:hypothetical protein
MNWYYERSGQAVGPVTEEAIQALRSSNELGPQSRLWREDWPDWKTVAQAWPVAQPTGQPYAGIPSMPLATAACAECGTVDPGAVEIQGLTICSNCQPVAVAKLREGIPLGGGPWREGKQVVVRRDAALPDRCVKCCETSMKTIKKRLYWHSPFLYILAFSPLIYIIVALCVRKTMTVWIPLCATCSGRRMRNIWIAWGSFFVSVALCVFGGSTMSRNDTLGGILMFSGIGVFFFMLFWIIGTRLIYPKKIDKTHGWIAKAGKSYLDSLPQWPGV